MPELYTIFVRKIFSPNFGGNVPCPYVYRLGNKLYLSAVQLVMNWLARN